MIISVLGAGGGWAVVSGLSLAATGGLLGPFLVWRGLSYVLDAFVHSVLLGIAASLWLGITPFVGIIFFSVAAAALLALRKSVRQSQDALVMLLAGGSVASALLLMELSGLKKQAIFSYFWGEKIFFDPVFFISSVVLFLGSVVFICKAWGSLLKESLEIQSLSGLSGYSFLRQWPQFVLTLGIFFFAMMGLRWFGALTLTLLLVAPTGAVYLWTRTPKSCVWMTALSSAAVFLMAVGALSFFELQVSFGPFLGAVWLGIFFLSQLVHKAAGLIKVGCYGDE